MPQGTSRRQPSFGEDFRSRQVQIEHHDVRAGPAAQPEGLLLYVR